MAPDDSSATPGFRTPLCQQALTNISQNIIETSESIIAITPAASSNSKLVIASKASNISQFHEKSVDVTNLQNLANPKCTRRPVQVINCDPLTFARELLQENPKAEGEVAVLNLAGAGRPGGGWPEWGNTQEAALCYSSTLHATLNPKFYPLPDAYPEGYSAISHRKLPSTATASTTNSQSCLFSHPGDRHWLKEKIRFILRVAASKGKRYLILGALGCRTGCPPDLVAKEMKAIIEEKEFGGWFRQIVFAIDGEPQAYGTWHQRPDTQFGQLMRATDWDSYCIFRQVFTTTGKN